MFDQAFNDAKRKGYDCIYIFVDIHGTVVKPNYSRDELPTEFYPQAKTALQVLSERDDCKLIMYTCSHPDDLVKYFNHFSKHGIKFDYINENPECVTGAGYGNYDYKPFYNILFDDRAFFTPETDWSILVDTFENVHYKSLKDVLLENKGENK